MEEKLDTILTKLYTIEHRLQKIEHSLEIVESETAKNAEVASWALKYTPTIDKIEGGLKRIMSPSNIFGSLTE